MPYLIGCEIHECEIVRRNISCVYSFDHSFLLVIVIVSFPFGNKLLDLVFGVLCWYVFSFQFQCLVISSL